MKGEYWVRLHLEPQGQDEEHQGSIQKSCDYAAVGLLVLNLEAHQSIATSWGNLRNFKMPHRSWIYTYIDSEEKISTQSLHLQGLT